MKRSIMILVIVFMLCAGSAPASEHSAISNLFTLDTRDTPWAAMQHSALSNIFTLDTRDMITQPGIRLLTPAPDSIITGPVAVIQAQIYNTGRLDTASIAVLLDKVEVSYVFDGELITCVTPDLSVGRHTITIKAGDIFGNTSEQTWSFTLRNPKVEKWDVNGDGIVNTQDIILVGEAFGLTGEGLAADVNGDDVVDMLDLVMVASHFGEKINLAAPVISQIPDVLQPVMLERWLMEAKAVDDGSDAFRRGIAVLETLLKAIVPEKTVLLQNYPNPFNPDTWIPYQLSQASDVSIIIYDVTGAIVRRLDLGRKPAGTYRTQTSSAYWDGRSEAGDLVTSGLYFVVLKAGDYQQARRMIIIR